VPGVPTAPINQGVAVTVQRGGLERKAAVKLTGRIAEMLIALGKSERRPVAWVAEWLILRGLEAEKKRPRRPAKPERGE
jgi:hypothetical protein